MIPSGIAGKPLFAMTKKLIAVFGATGAQGGGLVRAILHDPAGEFAVRAITRHTSSVKAQKPVRLGVWSQRVMVYFRVLHFAQN